MKENHKAKLIPDLVEQHESKKENIAMTIGNN